MKPTVYVIEAISDTGGLLDIWGIYSTREIAEDKLRIITPVQGEHYDIHEMIMDD